VTLALPGAANATLPTATRRIWAASSAMSKVNSSATSTLQHSVGLSASTMMPIRRSARKIVGLVPLELRPRFSSHCLLLHEMHKRPPIILSDPDPQRGHRSLP
jgi:hypothetical protein